MSFPIFKISDEQMEVESCVYILSYGRKYVIVKGKTLAGSIYLIEKGYAGFIAGGKLNMQGKGHKEGDGKNTFYFKFYRYISKNPGLQMNVDVLFEDTSGYKLLIAEQTALQERIWDKNCLNSNVEAYVPKYRKTTKSYGWISNAHVMNFKKFLKRPTPSDVNNR